MQVRDWMNENQPIVAGVVILILLLSFARIMCTLMGDNRAPRITEFFYYDVNTGNLFVANYEAVSPIAAPSDIDNNTGRLNGVRAFVFSCTDCSDPDTYMIKYLQRYTPKAKEAHEKMLAGEMSDEYMYISPEEESEIKRPGDENWVPSISEEANKIMEEAYQERCPDGERAKECFPRDQ